MAGMWRLEETVDATGLHQHPLLLTPFWAFHNPFPSRADCINRGRERACDWCSDKALVSVSSGDRQPDFKGLGALQLLPCLSREAAEE